MFGWILAILMIISAVFLFFGKGTWIVAGLNALTEEEKTEGENDAVRTDLREIK